ncbi:hypothetical protein HYPBUDRAFT_154031 [Hyphopichia burtonii NRRL Y-1933]|uniref:Uncharacterized protein n=1 Tax=Hyphopichia burtonii NRRL Y-1933 TaxID=984485 RepID=A0A1E4RD67_9ASCO|nr:hypothetical protein HYPBUDRAFT_154031 [Hyphopichia burtonii NRRL Y-1933]ODV65176.1 hypothetical protein HYPBUDRAFT_154031 [Hyphopichia burtonii NRRL Y-1933]
MTGESCVVYENEVGACPQFLEKIVKETPFLDKLSVISQSPVELADSKTWSKFGFRDLLQLIESIPVQEHVSLRASPSIEQFAPYNQLVFSSIDDSIKIQLNESSYKNAGYFNKSNRLKVKQRTPSKNSPHLFPTYHIVCCRSELTPDCKQLISTVFQNVNLKVVTLDSDFESALHADFSLEPSSTEISLLNGAIDLLSLVDPIANEDLHDYYEFITLVHLQSIQFTENLNSAISSYEAPATGSGAMTRPHHILQSRNLSSSVVSRVFDQSWLSISLNFENAHILILNTDSKIISWKVSIK